MRIIPLVLWLALPVASAPAADGRLPAAPPGGAQPVPITGALIEQLVREAGTNNPALLAAAERIQAARHQVAGVRTWEDPMFTLGYAVTSSRGFKMSEEGDLAYGLEQKLPLWGKPRSARQVAEAELAVAGANADFKRRQIRGLIARTIYPLALSERVAAILREDLEWSETMVDLTLQRYRLGTVLQSDWLRMQNEQAKRTDQLRTEILQRDQDGAALNRLLRREIRSPWPSLRLPDVAPPVAYTSELVAQALQNDARVAVLRSEIAQANAQAELVRRQRYPDVSVGIEGRQYSGDAGFREGFFTVKLNLPWGNAEKYRADHRREQSRVKVAALELADHELTLREELHHLVQRIDTARRQAVLYRDQIIPRAEQAITAAYAAWETQRGMINDLLDLRRQVLEGRLLFARAVTEQHQLISELSYYYGVGDQQVATVRPVATMRAPVAASPPPTAPAAPRTTPVPRHH